MRVLWRFVLLLVSLLLLVVILLPFTERGSRSLLELVGRYSPMEITYAGGTLAGQLSLSRIALLREGLVLEVSDIQAELAPACLWRSALCFRQLQAGQLSVEILPVGTTAATSPGPGIESELIKLTIADTRILWQGGEWRQGPAQLALQIGGSSIEILRAQLDRPQLLLRETDAGNIPQASRLDLGRINLPLSLSVDELVLEQPGWNLYGAPHQLQRIALSGQWQQERLHIASLEGSDQQYGDIQLQGEIDFSGDWPLSVRAEARSEWLPLELQNVELTAKGSLAALVLQVSASGVQQLDLNAQLDVLDRQLPFESSVELAWPSGQQLGEIEGVPVTLAEVVIDEPLRLVISGDLAGQQFEVQGKASGLGYHGLQLNASGAREQDRVVIHQLSLQDQAQTSELRVKGEIGIGEPLRASLQISSSGLELPDLSEYAFGRLQGGLQLGMTMTQSTWQVSLDEVDLTGYINDLPARVQGHSGLGGGLLLASSDLQAELNGARFVLQSTGQAGQPAHIALAVEDLGRWQPGSRGSLSLEGQLSPQSRDVALTGSFEDILWRGLQVDNGMLRGQYRGDGDKPFTLEASLADLELGDVQLESLSLNVAGTPAEHSLSLQTRGEMQGDLTLVGGYRDERWTAQLAPTRLQTPHGDWRLDSPVALDWSAVSADLSVSAHCWRQPSVSVCPGELTLGSEVHGSIAVDGEMDFLAGFLPTGVEVSGDMKLRLDGSWNEADGPNVKGHYETRGVRLSRHYDEGETASFNSDKGRAEIDYNRAGLKLDWQIQHQGRDLLGVKLLLPPARNEALTGTVTLHRFQLAALSAFVPTLSSLQGDINGEMRLSGTVDEPMAHGQLKLSQGRVALVGNPTQLEDLELSVNVLGDSAKLTGRGVLGGGDIQLTGLLISKPDWQFDLSIEGSRHRVLYPPSTELLLSENLQVTARPGLLNVAGDITVHEGLLEPEQLPEGSVAVSRDVVEVDYTGNVIREELPFDLALDVRVQVENRFRVSSELIEATLGGNLHVRQRPKRPLQLFGNLNVVGGQVRAYRQRLQIKRGNLAFTGRPDNPSVNVRAQRNISGSNVIAGVQLVGTLDEMVLEVYSEPAMSQGEAMSYLVRGRGLDASSGEDGTALALSLASGVVNRSTLVSELNRIPGVNNVTFGADGSAEDTAAAVSGYLGNRVYLSYGVGLYEPINVLTARLYLRTRLWLEVVSSLENSIDLYYSFDID